MTTSQKIFASLFILLLLILLTARYKPGVIGRSGLSTDQIQLSGAWESMQFINSSRSFPETDIPPAAYTNAYNFFQSHFSNKERNR